MNKSDSEKQSVESKEQKLWNGWTKTGSRADNDGNQQNWINKDKPKTHKWTSFEKLSLNMTDESNMSVQLNQLYKSQDAWHQITAWNHTKEPFLLTGRANYRSAWEIPHVSAWPTQEQKLNVVLKS